MKQTDIAKNAHKKFVNKYNKKHFLIGFDGFIDEIIHVVDKRKNPYEYIRVSEIKAFSERIAQVAGLSANIELVPVQTKLGGNGPIMANAVLAQDHDVTYIGAIGKHYIHPVFREFSEKCKKVISLTEPGHTDALEFYDGKIMLGKMNNLVDISWKNLLEKINIKEIEDTLNNTDLIAFTNWTMLSNLNSIMREFNNIIKNINNKPKVFIDLADPAKRTTEDIIEVLDIISAIETETVFSMNHNESTIISDVMGIKEDKLPSRAKILREKLNITSTIIHPAHGAVISNEEETQWIDGPYTSKPKLTTGAGDNFNTGFCNGWINNLKPSEALIIGVCTSGFYVRKEYSPSKNELSEFMQTWIDNDCGDI